MNKISDYFYDKIDEFKLNNIIKLDDIACWLNYKDLNWIYNKLELSKKQNMTSAPWPIIPKEFPIIIKPIINLLGMSRGFQIINSSEEYYKLKNKDGYFWQPYFEGKQFNVDLVIDNGKILDYFAAYSKDNKNGTFKYHTYIENYILDKSIINFIEKFLHNYKGLLNLEIIENNIIEVHLRLNGDYFLYEEKFIDKLINFYINDNYGDKYKIKSKNFFPIFTTNNKNYKEIIKPIIEKYKKYIIEYVFDDYNSRNQGFDSKRIFMFTTNDFTIGKKLQKKIYKNIKNN